MHCGTTTQHTECKNTGLEVKLCYIIDNFKDKISSFSHFWVRMLIDHHLGRHLVLEDLVLGLVNLGLGLGLGDLVLILVTGHILKDRDLTPGPGGLDTGLDHTPGGRVVGVAPAPVDLTDARGRVRDLGRPELNVRSAPDPGQ